MGKNRGTWRIRFESSRSQVQTLGSGDWVHVVGQEGESLPSGLSPRAPGGERLLRGGRAVNVPAPPAAPPAAPPRGPVQPQQTERRARRAGTLARWRVPLHQVAGLGRKLGVVSHERSARKRQPARSPHAPRSHALALPATSPWGLSTHASELTLTPTPRSAPAREPRSPCHAHPRAHPRRHTRSHRHRHTPPPPGTP